MNTEHTTHDNMFADVADVRHAQRMYTEVYVRHANRDLRDQLVAQRRRADVFHGVTPWHYRARKWLGKFFTAAAVAGSVHDIKDSF